MDCHGAATSNSFHPFIGMPLRIKILKTIETAIEQVEVTDEIWPNTILKAMNKMTNFVTSHREMEGPLIDSRDLKPFVMTTNAALEVHTAQHPRPAAQHQ